MRDFCELGVWKRAYSLNRWVYALVDSYPEAARYGLGARMQQAATDIACYIARGCGDVGNEGALRWHFNEAPGELSALDHLMRLAYDLRLIPRGCAQSFIGTKIDIQERLLALLAEEEIERREPASLRLVQ